MPKDLSPACEVRPADQSLKESPSHAEPARKVFGNRQMKSLRTNALPEHGVAKGVVDAQIRKIERREWWLWTSAILVTLLLTLGIVSFLVPILQPAGESPRFPSHNQRYTRPRRDGAVVRYLHGLPTASDISYSPPDGGARRALSPHHGKRRRYDCGGGF